MHLKKSALLFFIISCFAFASVVQANEAIIATDNLNVRIGPGTDFARINQVNTGEKFPILNRENEWVEIKMDHANGWVSTEFITVDSSPSDEDTTRNTDYNPATDTITIQYDNTHLRKGPSTAYDITGYAEKGEEFRVITEENNWLEISNGHISGYVFQNLVIHQKPPGSSGLENKTVIIDAGHGGIDVGAIGASGTYEKDFTYRTMQELKKELTVLGADVILTREADRYASLASRVSLSNIVDADAFISIHYNSFPQAPDATGIGTYYYHDRNEELADAVQAGLISTTDAADRNVQGEDYYVIRQNFQRAILIELGFISNPEKEQLLQTNSYQKQLVSGIVSGLTNYFK